MSGLQVELQRFRLWARTRNAEDAVHAAPEWECDYPHWQDLYAAVGLTLDAAPELAEFDDLLFALARDNEDEVILDMIADHPEFALELAHRALGYQERDARWQMAEVLGRIPGEKSEALLAKFLGDADEYVRRRAANSRKSADA